MMWKCRTERVLLTMHFGEGLLHKQGGRSPTRNRAVRPHPKMQRPVTGEAWHAVANPCSLQAIFLQAIFLQAIYFGLILFLILCLDLALIVQSRNRDRSRLSSSGKGKGQPEGLGLARRVRPRINVERNLRPSVVTTIQNLFSGEGGMHCALRALLASQGPWSSLQCSTSLNIAVRLEPSSLEHE